MKRILFFFLTLLILALAFPAQAEDALMVMDPYVRLVPPSAENTALFMVIHNEGHAARKLVKADSPVAAKVELHTVVKEGDVLKMRPVKSISVKAMGQTVLKPGGFHVMLIGLKKPLTEGQMVPVILSFDDGKTESIEAPVRK